MQQIAALHERIINNFDRIVLEELVELLKLREVESESVKLSEEFIIIKYCEPILSVLWQETRLLPGEPHTPLARSSMFSPLQIPQELGLNSPPPAVESGGIEVKLEMGSPTPAMMITTKQSGFLLDSCVQNYDRYYLNMAFYGLLLVQHAYGIIQFVSRKETDSIKVIIIQASTLALITSALIYTIIIFRRRDGISNNYFQKKCLSYIDLILAIWLMGYIFLARFHIISSFEFDSNKRDLWLYYALMIGQRTQDSRLLLLSGVSQLIMHACLIIFYLSFDSNWEYFPIVLIAIQFIFKDNFVEWIRRFRMEEVHEIDSNGCQCKSQGFNRQFFETGALIDENGFFSDLDKKGLKQLKKSLPNLSTCKCPSRSFSVKSRNSAAGLSGLLSVGQRFGQKQMDDEKWRYLNEIPVAIGIIKSNLERLLYLNEYMWQLFSAHFQKNSEPEILEMLLKQMTFRIMTRSSTTERDDKKRITKFSSIAKRHVRESLDRKSLLQQTRNSTAPGLGNEDNFSKQGAGAQQNDGENNKTEKAMNLQEIFESLEKQKKNGGKMLNPSNMSVEIYGKSVSIESGESISIKGKIICKTDCDEYLIILEDITQYEQITTLADRDDYKNRLISSFSHELRTPLNSGMGFLQSALFDDTVSQAAKEAYIDPAFQSLKFQLYYINDILDFSQILAKRDLQLHFDRFNIQQLVSELKSLYQTSFNSKGISFLFKIHQKAVNLEICSDYGRLMQVIVNLLNNSLRFTTKGNVVIRINTTIKGNIAFDVEDTGQGMNLQQFEQIKAKLAAFGSSGIQISETQHAGFGLTISQMIVSILAPELNSELSLKKTEGGGCTFSFCIENILTLQSNFSLFSNNTGSRFDSSMNILKTRKETRKLTYAHTAHERTSFSGRPNYVSSNNLLGKDMKRGNTTAVGEPSWLVPQRKQKKQVSMFKPSTRQDESMELQFDHYEKNIKFDLDDTPKSSVVNKRGRIQSSEHNHQNVDNNENSESHIQENSMNLVNMFRKLQDLPGDAMSVHGMDDSLQSSTHFNQPRLTATSYLFQKLEYANQLHTRSMKQFIEEGEQNDDDDDNQGDLNYLNSQIVIQQSQQKSFSLQQQQLLQIQLMQKQQQKSQESSLKALSPNYLNNSNHGEKKIFFNFDKNTVNFNQLQQIKIPENDIETYSNLSPLKQPGIKTNELSLSKFAYQNNDGVSIEQLYEEVSEVVSSNNQVVEYSDRGGGDFAGSQLLLKVVAASSALKQNQFSELEFEAQNSDINLINNSQQLNPQYHPTFLKISRQVQNQNGSFKSSLSKPEEKVETKDFLDTNVFNRPYQKSEIIEKQGIQSIMKCKCRRILCVDDEIFNLQILMLLLAKLGYSIQKAFNGQDAIEQFSQFYSNREEYTCGSPSCTVFKAVLLDCNMPIMNGWECSQKMRNLMSAKKLPQVPIIAITAYVAQQAFQQCKESGMDEVLNKPIQFILLQQTMEKYIHMYENDPKYTKNNLKPF